MKNFATALAFILFGLSAHANLQVFPTRVVLTESAPAAQVSVRHKGDKVTNYKISVVFYEMKPDGTMQLVPDSKAIETSAINNIKFSPRRVTLRPNEEQVVRILSSHVSDLKEGEYRAHIYFESMDDIDDVPQAPTSGNSAQLFLKARMAVAIPVIIRRGVTDSKAELSDLGLKVQPDKSLAFSAELKKIGNRNLYGDFRIKWQKPSGEIVDVGAINGVSSYLPQRNVTFPLTVQDPELYKNGILQAEFHEPAADGGKLLARTEVKIGAAVAEIPTGILAPAALEPVTKEETAKAELPLPSNVAPMAIPQ
jgi:hypothetical protein